MDRFKEICVLPVTIACFFLIFLTLNCITFIPYSTGLRDKIVTVKFTDFKLKKNMTAHLYSFLGHASTLRIAFSSVDFDWRSKS